MVIALKTGCVDRSRDTAFVCLAKRKFQSLSNASCMVFGMDLVALLIIYSVYCWCQIAQQRVDNALCTFLGWSSILATIHAARVDTKKAIFS